MELGSTYRHVVARAESLSQEFMQQSFAGEHPFEIVASSDGLLHAADVGIVKSGTSTLQTALIGTPFVVIYKSSPITYWLGRALAKVDYLSIVNILSNRLVVPEFLQEKLNVKSIMPTIDSLLTNRDQRETMLRSFEEIAATLRGNNPYQDAAQSIIESIG